GPGVAEVAVVVRRRAADVHLGVARRQRGERRVRPHRGVVQTENHDVANAATGAARLSPLPADEPDAPVARTRASKPISFAGICHRPAGPIDQRKIAAFARRKPWVQIPLGPLPPASRTAGVPGTKIEDAGLGIRRMHNLTGQGTCIPDGCRLAARFSLDGLSRNHDALHATGGFGGVLLEIREITGPDM